jgi:hypothetical protein
MPASLYMCQTANVGSTVIGFGLGTAETWTHLLLASLNLFCGFRMTKPLDNFD